MKLYAFVLSPGSGKTYNSRLYDNVVDIDSAIAYTPHLRALIKKGHWDKLMHCKAALLKDYLKKKYKENDTIILLVHGSMEAEIMNASIIGEYKACLEDIKASGALTSNVKRGWKTYKEIKTHKEIEAIIKKAVEKLLY